MALTQRKTRVNLLVPINEGLVAGHIPYVADNLNDTKDIPPDNIDADVVPDLNALTNTNSQNSTKLPELTAAYDQYLNSDYVAFGDDTAALTCYGIITKEDTNQVIGLHKLRLATQKYRLKKTRISDA